MDNMSRQYRKENGINSSISSQKESKGNINSKEEALLLGLIQNNLGCIDTKVSGCKTVRKVKLEDLAGHSKKQEYETRKASSTITLEELAKNHSK